MNANLARGGEHEFEERSPADQRVHFVYKRQQLNAKAVTIDLDDATDPVLGILFFVRQNMAFVAVRHELGTEEVSEARRFHKDTFQETFNQLFDRLVADGTPFVVRCSYEHRTCIWWQRLVSSEI